MSCRSTPFTSAATTVARVTSGLDDAQVQSLFHALRKEGKGKDKPSREEYGQQLEKMIWLIRHDEQMDPRTRDRALYRLHTAEAGELPEGDTWYASTMIANTAGTSRIMLDNVMNFVASDLDVEPERMSKIFNQWRSDKKGLFEDYPSPIAKYRYDTLPGVPTDKKTSKALRKLGYEQYLAQPLPVFVYGTLREGQGNARLMENARIHTLPAKVNGVGVYGSRHGFPYAAEHEDPEAITIGEVAWLSRDEEGEKARTTLDYLEGFDSDYPHSSHYIRTHKIVDVTLPDGSQDKVAAWMYLAQGTYAERLNERDRIEHGDWVAEMRTLFIKHR